MASFLDLPESKSQSAEPAVTFSALATDNSDRIRHLTGENNTIQTGPKLEWFKPVEMTARTEVAPAKMSAAVGQFNFENEKNKLNSNFAAVLDGNVRDKATEWQTSIEGKIAAGTLSKQEAAATYDQVNRLLTTPSTLLSDNQRAKVAAEILFHTGQVRVDQGLHGTCNVAVLENIAFTKKPSLAAEMITTAALTGKWKSPDGKEITIPSGSLETGWEESEFPPPDMLRSHASQIFQVVALNDVGQHQARDPMQFIQEKAGVGSILLALGKEMLPFGEYWLPKGDELWRHASGKTTEFEGLGVNQIVEEANRLFGKKYDVAAYKSPYESWSHPFSSDGSDAYAGAKMVQSENDLRSLLTRENLSARLPLIVAVNGENSRIMKDSDAGDMAVGALRWLIRPIKSLHERMDIELGIANHVVTITKFDAAHDRVYIDNSWGKDKDGWLPVDDLWQSL